MYQQSVTRVPEWSIWRPFTKTAGKRLDRARWHTHQMWMSRRTWRPFSTQQVSEWRFSVAQILRPDGLVGI